MDKANSRTKKLVLLFRPSKKLAKAIFSAETVFSCTFGAVGENCKEALRGKASEAGAHVVSFGIKVGGLRPSDTSQGGYRQADSRTKKLVLLF